MSEGIEFPVHIPASFLGKEELTEEQTAIRHLAVRLQGADFKIGIWTSTPTELSGMKGPLIGMRQTAMVGHAILQVLETAKPRFHYSVTGNRLCRTTGTTIAITGRSKDDRSTVVGTWDYGESSLVAFRRLNVVRKLLATVPSQLAASLLFHLKNPDWPPPQVLVSNVMNLEYPDMALGSAPGASPIAIAVGSKFTHMVFDHRLYDPVDEAEFVKLYNAELKGALEHGMDNTHSERTGTD